MVNVTPRLPLLDPDPGTSESMYRLADEIVGRLSGMELSAIMGKYLRKVAEFGPHHSTFVLYPGNPDLAVFGSSVIRPDGSMLLELSDHNGQIFWRTHLRPASDD